MSSVRMLLHGFLHAFTGKSKYPLVKCKAIEPIWILLYILTTQGIAQAENFGEFKAVFSKPCTGIMTLSSPVPNATQFTLCTYIKLDSSNPWTAFTYKLPSSPNNVYEIGLLGDSSSIKIWMFGTRINVYKSLNLLTWYEMCITWSAQTQNMYFYIDGTLEEERTLENYTELQGGGNVVLGCSTFDEANSTTSVGLVGELYMFRMWAINDIGYFQKCMDGDIIKWDTGYWIYSPDVVQQDLTLHCAKTPPENPTNSQISNNIHMFHKRASGNESGSSITNGQTIPPAYSSATAPQINNTSIDNIPWTSSIVTNGNETCAFDSTEVQNLYNDICKSNFSCSGTVSELIIQGDCTSANIEKKLFKPNADIKFTILTIPGGCRVLINNSIDCELIKNTKLTVQARNSIDYCCCEEACRQSSNCSIHQTNLCDTGTTTGLQTTGYSNSNFSITIGSDTTINNTIRTTVNSQPITTSKDVAKTTVLHTESVSITSTDSNRTINSETTLTINSSIKTTVNSGSTTSINRTSSTTVISVPTTSLTSDSGTPPKMTFSTSLHTDTTFFEVNSSSGTTISVDIAKALTYMEDLLAGEVNATVAKEMFGILNSILSTSQNLSASDSMRLIKIVNQIGLKLNFPEQSINLTSQYLALAVNKINASRFTETSFGVESSSGLQVTLNSHLPENSTGSVLLPASLLNDLSSANKDIASRVQFNYFAKTSFFVDSSISGKKQLVSNVISASVANLSITNLKQNVTVTLETANHNASAILECVFWDFTKNSGNGGWSSEGCTKNSTTQNNNNQTVCKCNHLTSFAILLDMTADNSGRPEDILILTFITYIGCGLSAIFLSVTLVTYIAFEKIRRDYPSKILIQLCAALIGLNLTFLMDPWIALYSEIPGLCISVAAFLHYFLLVSITWMGLEAFHMYLSLVKVFNTYIRKYILKFCIIGWGAPAVVVAIILAVNKDLYELHKSAPYPNGASDYFCWMKDIIYWITVVGYFGIIFMLNVSMFVVVLIQLCRIKKQKQLGYQRKTMLQDIRSVAGITFLLGITWGLGFFSFGPGKIVIQFLFTIFNSLQGFFIFFFYCVAKENVRKQWRRYLCCGKLRLAENSDWSKTATNKLKKQTSKQGVSSSSSNSIQSTSNSNSNSTTLLVSNEYSMHPNGNGNVFKERNGVTFMPQNGEVQMQEFPERPSTRNGDVQRTSVRRTSNRGSVHFVDQI